MSQRQDGGVRRRALDAAVPAQIVVSAIPVVFAIRLVMLAVVAHEVGEREAVMAGDEVDGRGGGAGLVGVEVAAAGDAARNGADDAGVAAHEAAHDVPVGSVPLGPGQSRKSTHLIETGGVPGLCNVWEIGERAR